MSSTILFIFEKNVKRGDVGSFTVIEEIIAYRYEFERLNRVGEISSRCYSIYTRKKPHCIISPAGRLKLLSLYAGRRLHHLAMVLELNLSRLIHHSLIPLLLRMNFIKFRRFSSLILLVELFHPFL
jgi:hypothetical protein